MIIKCTCTHAYQDARYGRGNRVMNRTKQASAGSRQSYRCTVCGKEQDHGGVVASKVAQVVPQIEAPSKAKAKMVKTEKKGRVR